MDFLKNLFNGNALTYEQFEDAVKTAKLKIADISKGDYVSVNKYNNDLAAKDTQISTLNDTIAKRDTDLADLQNQLKAAGTDATKLSELSTNFENLKTQYTTDVENYKAQLAKQAYEFAVKEFANSKKFTSNAAKRDFVQSMIAKDLKLENNVIIGAEDFVTMYEKENDDAFVKASPEPASPAPNNYPQFVGPTSGIDSNPDNSNMFKFDFVGVRPHDNK